MLRSLYKRSGVHMPKQEKNRGAPFQQMAATVARMPSVDARYYLLQGLFVALISLCGLIMGHTVGGAQTAMVFMLAGMVASGLLSGLALMVLGLVRVANRRTGSF